MADNPIPPVDPVTRTPRVIGRVRHVEVFVDPPRVDAATQQQWQEALARELAAKKIEAVHREDGRMLRRWREVVRALWPGRREDSAQAGAPGKPQQKR
jgi:hypothetical protein